MKTFALAASAGLLLTAGTADAQFMRSRGGSGYNMGSSYGYRTQSYGYAAPSSLYAPTYGYPTYSAPLVTSGVVTSGYAPLVGSSNVIVPASDYSSFVAPTYGAPGYSGYSTYPTYGSTYYGTSTGTYVAPAGGMFRGMMGRRR